MGRDEAAKIARHMIGNGEKTLFWKDPWHPEGILMDKFPQQLTYNSVLHKEAKVSSVIVNGEWAVLHQAASIISDITDQLQHIEVNSQF